MDYQKIFDLKLEQNQFIEPKDCMPEDYMDLLTVNEFLTTDLTNLKLAIKKFKLKVTDSKIIKNMESIITAQVRIFLHLLYF